MKAIEQALADIQNLHSLDRGLVDIFIKRIEIDKTGNIKIIIHSDYISRYKLSEKGLTNEVSVPFVVNNDIEYKCDSNMMLDVLKHMTDNKEVYPLFSFTMVISGFNKENRWNNHKKVDVLVCLKA